MRAPCTLTALTLGLALTPGCFSEKADPPERYTVSLDTAAHIVFHCTDTIVTPLAAPASGFHMACPIDNEEQMTLRLGTDAAGNSVITGIDLVTKREAHEIVLPDASAELATRGFPACEGFAIDEKRMQPAPKMEDGHLAFWRSKFFLAYPCGEAILTVGPSLVAHE